jgi:intein/homing endonuclease
MSNNASSAENQQATHRFYLGGESSETTSRTPLAKNEILAYLHGAMHDASLNKGKRIRFVQKYRDWLVDLQSMLKIIGYNSWIYKEGKTRNLYVLETLCNKLSFEYDPNNLKTDNEKRMYIQGFFDAEGGIPRNGKTFYIQLVQKDKLKISKLKCLLTNLGIETGKIHNPSRRIDPDYWRIFVSTQYHQKFAQLIGSRHPIKKNILCERMKI